MSDSTVPDFFWRFPMQRVRADDLDARIAEETTPVAILFLWGRDCPNCDVAKRAMLHSMTRFQWPQVRWLHGNVYEQAELGTRFGLHGVPAFIVFRGTRRIGRITPWPGVEDFIAAIETQIEASASGQVDRPRSR